MDLEDAGAADFKKVLADTGQVFPGSELKWNFTKFLVDKNGQVVDRFFPATKPADIEAHIEKLLTA